MKSVIAEKLARKRSLPIAPPVHDHRHPVARCLWPPGDESETSVAFIADAW